MAPPRNLHQAMMNSDEIIIITNLEWANRFAHVSAVRESCDNNAKIASVEEGIGSWNLTEADILDATDRARAAIAAMEGAKWCQVTSPAGTDVRVSIEGRPALEVTPIKKRGQMMGPMPLWAEVAFAAVEDKTEGRSWSTASCSASGCPVRRRTRSHGKSKKAASPRSKAAKKPRS